MEIKKISKARIGDYPMFPRAEYKGISMEGEQPEKEDFKAVKKDVPLTQANYKEVDAEIIRTRDQACRWWAFYGNNGVIVPSSSQP